ncbi:hypothetical protein F5X99DRAFT_412138 [Biscogniauxia marginata]|nr:hypothetical protein F5X99DRAFT_412138 [Biscogniauxia marginata]
MPPSSTNHAEIAPLTEFHYFKQLPPEIRLEIWKHHLWTVLGPRVHRITSINRLHNGYYLHLSFTINSFAKRTISPNDMNITRECQTAARWVELARGAEEPVLADIINNARSLYSELPLPSLDRGLELFAALARPTRINWAEDVLYLKLPNVRNPFDFLLNPQEPRPWIGKVQRLALYLNARSITQFRPRVGHPIGGLDERAVPFESLRELTLIIDRPVPSLATATAMTTVFSSPFAAEEGMRGTEAHGFVEFTEAARRRLFADDFVQLAFSLVHLHFIAAWRLPLLKIYGRELRLRVAAVNPAARI